MGELPQRSYVHDTWHRCPSQIGEYHDQQRFFYKGGGPWSEFGPLADEYFDTVENIYTELVRTGPMSLAEPVALTGESRFGVKTHAVGDPDLLITYTTEPEYWNR